ncbi:ATP-binding protein [Thioflexithrix psekupsensis]|uniref:histidine kinase n=1 Tax=Thioflexithrix psekupsensis TaxID=1570016 RepID=A0A251X4B9_9GAMM|nr:ATP-binding protein [Thioflexithrix psekupsensis]OUD12240.1 hypothetical protein TPSD3_14060 [Thioflexithrix psekupsensis]
MKKHAHLWTHKYFFKISLRKVLIIAFILQLLVILSLVNILSFRYGQQAVLSVTERLREEITARVTQNLQTYLNIPVALNQIHSNAIESQLLNPYELKIWRDFLWKQIKYHDSISFTVFGNERGDFISVGAKDEKGNAITGVNISRLNGEYDLYRYRTDKNGRLTDLVSVNTHFDPRTRPWYKAAVEAGKPTWSDIFQRTDDPNLVLSATRPIYDSHHTLQGVLTTSFRLSALSEFLETLDMPEGGLVYIIEDTHKLVANSIREPIYRIAHDGVSSLRRHTEQSEHKLIQISGHHLQNQIKKNGALAQFWNSTFEFGQQEYLLQVTPFQLEKKINWLIVVVLPKKAFMSPIYESTRDTIMLSLVATFIAMISAWLMARWISRPLRQLQQRVHWLMALDWEKSTLPIQLKTPAFFNSKMEEVDDLAHSFNEMAKKLQHSFDTVQAVYNNAACGIMLFNLAGQIRQMNDLGCELFGYQSDEMNQVNLFHLMPTIDRGYHQQKLANLLNNKTDNYRSEQRFNRKSGELFWLEIWVARIVLNGVNELTFMAVLLDVNDRKRMLQALNENRQRLQSIINHLPLILYHVDSNGIFTLLEGRGLNILDMNPSDIVGQSIVAIYKDNPEILRNLEKSLKGDFVRYELALNEVVFEVQQFPVHNEEGQTTSMIGVALDITERRQAEQVLQRAHAQAEQARKEAEQANHAKSAFLANMSHELRTPLNSILGYAQLLIQANQLNEHQKESLRIIMRSGAHLLTLINDVLDISKIEAGKLELFPSDFYLPEFLKEIVDLFRLRATQKGLTFGYEQIPTHHQLEGNKGFPIIVHADEKRLRQILLNLLSNAVKFTEKGHVSLKIIYRDNHLRFDIEDTGCGIPTDQLEKIFLPFQQIGSQNYVEGTGLGLSITRRLVEAMGGELHVNSMIGVGSIFWFEVQLAALSYTVKTPPTTELLTIKGYHPLMTSNHHPKTYRILIVDDISENRLLLVNLLKPLGFELKEAKNGFETLLIAKNWRPDAILMDLKLPKIDGLNITRRLRKHPRFQDTIIIALTADLFEYNRENSLEAGCNLFLTKPVEHQQLLDGLQQTLQLEWDYAPSSEAEKNAEKKITPHPLEQQQKIDALLRDFDLSTHIEQLAHFCRAGRISQITQYVRDLQNQQPELQPFTEVILTHSRSFNIAKIQLFLQTCQKE